MFLTVYFIPMLSNWGNAMDPASSTTVSEGDELQLGTGGGSGSEVLKKEDLQTSVEATGDPSQEANTKLPCLETKSLLRICCDVPFVAMWEEEDSVHSPDVAPLSSEETMEHICPEIESLDLRMVDSGVPEVVREEGSIYPPDVAPLSSKETMEPASVMAVSGVASEELRENDSLVGVVDLSRPIEHSVSPDERSDDALPAALPVVAESVLTSVNEQNGTDDADLQPMNEPKVTEKLVRSKREEVPAFAEDHLLGVVVRPLTDLFFMLPMLSIFGDFFAMLWGEGLRAVPPTDHSGLLVPFLWGLILREVLGDVAHTSSSSGGLIV